MQFRVLGALDVVDADGASLALGATRQRTLLATLLLDVGCRVSTDRLVEIVWAGDELPRDPRRALRTYVSRLRTLLKGVAEESVLVGEPDGYRLAVADDVVDARRFARAVAGAQELLGAARPEEARMEADRAPWACGGDLRTRSSRPCPRSSPRLHASKSCGWSRSNCATRRCWPPAVRRK